MPEKKTLRRAQKDKREGKAPSTQAGEFVREEFHHIREGKHGAASNKQAIAIGLSKARRAGIDLKAPKKGKVSEKSRKSAKSAYEKGQKHEPISKTRSAARKKALKKEPHVAASSRAISRHSKAAAKKRTPKERSATAKKAVRTKGSKERSEAAKKTARTRAAKGHTGGSKKTAPKRAKVGSASKKKLIRAF